MTTHPVTQRIVHRTAIVCWLSASVIKIKHQLHEFKNLTSIQPSPSLQPRSIVRWQLLYRCSLAWTIIKCSPTTTHQSTTKWRPNRWWMGHFNFRHANQITQGSVFHNVTAEQHKKCYFCTNVRIHGTRSPWVTTDLDRESSHYLSDDMSEGRTIRYGTFARSRSIHDQSHVIPRLAGPIFWMGSPIMTWIPSKPVVLAVSSLVPVVLTNSVLDLWSCSCDLVHDLYSKEREPDDQ